MAESIVCQDPNNCDREHVGGLGGTPVHLPPDGVVVPGHFDHGVPSDSRHLPFGRAMSERETLAEALAAHTGCALGLPWDQDDVRATLAAHLTDVALSWLAGVLADDATVEVATRAYFVEIARDSATPPEEWATLPAEYQAMFTRRISAALAALSAHLAPGPVRAGDTSGEDGQ